MSLSPGPFYICFIVSILLTIYLYVILHHTSLFYGHVIRLIIIGIVLVFVRMSIPVNFPFSYTVYSYKILLPILKLFSIPIGIKNYILFDLLFAIWSIISIILLIRLMIHYKKAKEYFSYFCVTNDKKYHNLFNIVKEYYDKPIQISIVPDNISPGIIGIIHPILILPNTDTLTEEELRYICIHEIGHIKNHHLTLTLLLEITCCMQWWNISIYIIKKEYSLFLELANDKYVINTYNNFNKITYANLMIKVAKSLSSSSRLSIIDSLCFTTNYHSATNTRVKFILNDNIAFDTHKKYNKLIHFPIIICIVLASLFFVPEATMYSPGNTVGDGIDITENNAYFTENEEGYTFHLNGESSFFGKEIPEDMKEIPIIKEGEKIHEK